MSTFPGASALKPAGIISTFIETSDPKEFEKLSFEEKTNIITTIKQYSGTKLDFNSLVSIYVEDVEGLVKESVPIAKTLKQKDLISMKEAYKKLEEILRRNNNVGFGKGVLYSAVGDPGLSKAQKDGFNALRARETHINMFIKSLRKEIELLEKKGK